MKSLLLCGIIYAFLFSGCALTGVNWIHSPHAQTGSGVRCFHVHGGATPHSPPDTWRMILEDSTRVDIYARTISQKTCWGGIGLPVFPLFWLPRESGYPDSATSLLLYLGINSRLVPILPFRKPCSLPADRSIVPIRSLLPNNSRGR